VGSRTQNVFFREKDWNVFILLILETAVRENSSYLELGLAECGTLGSTKSAIAWVRGCPYDIFCSSLEMGPDLINMSSGCVPCHIMVLPRAAVGRDGLQVWMTAVNVSNKKLWTGERELSSNVLGGWEDNYPYHKNKHVTKRYTWP
jgi:hypothetical protein